MFATPSARLDFAETQLMPAGPARFDSTDAQELFAQAEAAERSLLKLVLCAAVATLVLALATSLSV